MEPQVAVESPQPRPRPAAWRQALVVLGALAILGIAGYSIKSQLWDEKKPTVPAQPLRAAGAQQAPAKPAGSGSRLGWLNNGVRMIKGLTTQLEAVTDQATATRSVAKLLQDVAKFNGFAEQLGIHPDVLEADYTEAEKKTVGELDAAIQQLTEVATRAGEKGKGTEYFEDSIRRALAAADRIQKKVHKK